MDLSPTQSVALRVDIAADPVLGALAHTPDNAQRIADAYNLAASPAFTVWKTTVSITEVGDKFNGAELAALTTGNQSRLQTIALYSGAGVNPSLADRRAFFDDVFSGAGGTVTRGALLALWKRLATRAERLYATGTGSSSTPGTLVEEGALTLQNVQDAWNS
jgi:hypothetical protein